MSENISNSIENFSIKDFLSEIIQSIKIKNLEYLQQLENLKSDIMTSAEFFKITYSSMLKEDLSLFLIIENNAIITKRHAECILRNSVEQVIEFKYLIKNPKEREEFSGNKDCESTGNFVDDLCQLGSGRFKGGRKSVSQMAIDINEKIDTDEKLSLYSIYRILSEQAHNASFHEMLDNVSVVENEEEKSFLEENCLYLILLLDSFMESYSK